MLQKSGSWHLLKETDRSADYLEPFVSHAENLEDVILWRAFKAVDGGFYLDICPGNPEQSSVTRSFYERGWSGINIEPREPYYSQLQIDRPRDLNLRLSVRGRVGVLELFASDGKSSDGPEPAPQQHNAQEPDYGKLATQVATLSKICEEHVTRGIQLLRLNLEGPASEILGSMDFGRFRPWVVMILGSQPDHACEETLRTADYRFAYNDGLNRFYLANERYSELAPQFATPPNVFDGFVRAGERQAQREIDQLRAEKLEFEQSLFESERYAGFLAAQRQKLLDDYAALQKKNKQLKAMATRPSARVMNAAQRLLQRFKRA